MKKRIETLEAKHQSEKTDIEQMIEFAQWWKTAVFNHEWKKAISIREAAEPLFDKYPEWVDDPKDLKLKKELFMNWPWFAKYLEKETRQQYVKAIKEGVNPGFVLISSK